MKHNEYDNFRDVDDKTITIFVRLLTAYVALLFFFLVYTIAQAEEPTTDGLTPDASVSEADAVEIQNIINQLEQIETPNMDVDIQLPMPSIDMYAPNYLEMVYYRMFTALHARAMREGKSPDFYVNIFKAQWEAEHVKSSGEALKVIRMLEPTCPNGFEIYEGSGICNQFPTHISAEQNYYHCSLNNYQLWLENSDLKRQLAVRDIPDFKDGAGRGRLWKPEADPKARCAGGTTILLEANNPARSIDILDSNFRKIKSPPFYNVLDDGRPRFCAERMPGSSFGSGPIFIEVNGSLFRVNNPANRED